MSEVALKRVSPSGSPGQLRLDWSDGVQGQVDLTSGIARVPAMASLRDPDTFGQAAIADDGWAVEWPGEIDIDSHSLFALAAGQGTLTLDGAALAGWRVARGLLPGMAARELGITTEQLERFERSMETVPQTVALAFRSLRAAIPTLDAA